VEPDRVRLDGTAFRLETPDLVVASLELEGGAVARLTASFYVGPSQQRGLELHGDEGSLYLATWDVFDARLELKPRRGEYAPVPPLRPAYQGVDWSRPLVDLAEALEEGRPHRMGAEHAAHVVEVLEAVERSIEQGAAVDVRSAFPPPAPLPWAR
jgi:predicted dehydrogenase